MTHIFPFDKVPKGSRIVLYGAGEVGKQFYRQITETKSCEIVLWLDKNADGISTKKPEAIKNTSNYDLVVIAIKNGITAFDVKSLLVSYGVPDDKILLTHSLDKSMADPRLFIEFANELRKEKEIVQKPYSDILFINPPYWDVYSPFSAVPCLIAELKKYDISAYNLDIGIMVFHTNFNKNWYKISRNFYTQYFYEKYFKDEYSYSEYLGKINFLDCESSTLNDFKKVYKDLDTFQKNLLDTLFSKIMNEYIVYPILYKDGLDYGYDVHSLTDTIKAFNLASLFINIPKIVGFSVTSRGQFVATLALIKIVKAFRRDIKIIAGGSYLSVIMNTNKKLIKQMLCEYIDYIVLEEGETAVRMLSEHLLRGKHKIEDIPNIVFLRNGDLVEAELRMENANELAVPDYKDIDFSLYVSQEPMLAYQTSRGCFWGNCAFCNHNDIYRHNWRIKEVDKAVHDLKILYEKYNVCHFQFVDEAIEPKYFAKFVDCLLKEDFSKKIKWFYYSRISHLYNDEILQKARAVGCEMVMLGVETFSQRMLGYIKKGTTYKNIKGNLELFKRNGIKTFTWLMGVLPSQTKEEILYDMECFNQNVENIDGAFLGYFYLDVHCDIYKEPAKFGIVKASPMDGYEFDSVNNGALIDKQEVLEAFNLYKKEVRKYYPNMNRYILFFKE